MTGHDINAYFKTHYPLETAYEWDHVGLQVGSLNQKIKKIMITLDVTNDVVKEAIEKGVNFIISHHPLMFHPLQTLNLDGSKGKLIEKLVTHKITVYSAHTNYDVSKTGMNEVLAELLELKDISVLEDDPIRPMGRFGHLKAPLDVDAFIKQVKNVFHLDYALLIGKRNKPIVKVAISAGSGSIHYMAAKKKKADIYLTGDITYHTALDMVESKMLTLDIGHFTEHHFKKQLKKELEIETKSEIIISKESSPYRVY